MKIFIIVPVYNEGKVFEDWLPRLLDVSEGLGARVVVVEDGSDKGQPCERGDGPAPPIGQVLSRGESSNPANGAGGQENYVLLRHQVNCGVGAAIATGMEYARRQGADKLVTIDGDGQHDPQDIVHIIDKLKEKGVDVANGSRFIRKQRIPGLRRIANFLANIITYLLSGIWVTDTQSGMKGFSKRALNKIEIYSAGYEWCSDVFRQASWYKWRIEEVPISVLYNSYTLRKGQGFAVGLDMLMRLMVRSLMRNIQRP